jgi:hypothetical protein
MATIPSQSDRATVDGTEYLAGAAGGSDYKILISKIKDYVLTFFSNKTQLDKISESGGLPQYDSKPFGSLVKVSTVPTISTDFTVALLYSQILKYTLDTATDYEVTFSNITAGAIVVLVITPTANVTFTWNAAIKWVDGDPLLSMSNGEEARVYIASDGTTNGAITMNYVMVETYSS